MELARKEKLNEKKKAQKKAKKLKEVCTPPKYVLTKLA